MKLHDRDWSAFILRSSDGLGELMRLLKAKFREKLILDRDSRLREQREKENDQVVAGFEFRTPRQYFVIPENLEPHEFFDNPDNPDVPRRIESGENYEYGYPCYAMELGYDEQEKATDILLTCPYVRLAKEIWQAKRIFPGPAFREFVTFDLDALLSLMRSDSEVAARIRLRIGKAEIEGISTVRGVRISGNNVFESFIYGWLFGRSGRSAVEVEARGQNGDVEGSSPSIRLRTDAVRIGYHDEIGRGVAVYIDKHGNLRFRPGYMLSLLGAFRRLYRFCGTRDVLMVSRRHPISRAPDPSETSEEL